MFSAENGFAVRKVILYDGSSEEPAFYEVKDPAVTGQRSDLLTARRMQLMVLAQKTTDVPVFAKPPQQSDYAATWEKHQETSATGNTAAPSGWLQEMRVKLNPHWPRWLRRLRDTATNWKTRWRNGRPSLSNRRHYRKLSWQEVTGERALAK